MLFIALLVLYLVSEWVSDCYLRPIQQLFSYIEQINYQWDDDEVRFVLDQHAELDFIVLAHWNNNSRIDISLHSDTSFWLRANPTGARIHDLPHSRRAR
jgi:hypothetical protein